MGILCSSPKARKPKQHASVTIACLTNTPPACLPLNTDYTLLNNHLYSAGQLRSAGRHPLPRGGTGWEGAAAACPSTAELQLPWRAGPQPPGDPGLHLTLSSGYVPFPFNILTAGLSTLSCHQQVTAELWLPGSLLPFSPSFLRFPSLPKICCEQLPPPTAWSVDKCR